MAFCASSAAFADQANHSTDLSSERKAVIMQYIGDLQKADYKDIAQLFEKNGFVVSTSRGHVNAKDFFYAFLPNVSTANTEIHQTFFNDADQTYAARFHFSFKLRDGELGDGEYVDEFVFSDHSSKLSAVYMFENLKFDIAPVS
jgi:hypothetical protein